MHGKGRIREYPDPDHRLAAVVREFSAQPGKTVIVAPDRSERQELTQLLRAELKTTGALAPEGSQPMGINRTARDTLHCSELPEGRPHHLQEGNREPRHRRRRDRDRYGR